MRVSACVEQYVRYRRALGVGFCGEEGRLRAFVRSVGDVGMRSVTPAAVRRFLDGDGPVVVNNWLSKYHMLTGFYRFAVSRGYAAASPLPRDPPRRQPSLVPYIYSAADVRRLLDAAGQRYRNCWLMSPATLRTLLLLLYGSGLRISEALALDVGDVDLTGRVLTVRRTKFYKSRLVPIGADLHAVLAAYAGQHRTGDDGDDRPFLTDRQGRRIAKQTAQLSYRRVREHAGLRRRSVPGMREPRLHDLRHTFAVNRLLAWYRSGQDVQRLLPHLATYLGHRGISGTQAYLHLTGDLAQAAGDRFLAYASGPSSTAKGAA